MRRHSVYLAGRLALPLVCCCLPLAAADKPKGEEAPEVLPDIVVEVQRVRQAKTDIAAPVTVISPQEQAAVVGQSVVDVLRTVPGIDLRPTGSAAGMVYYNLRGANADQVLVLVDGRRVGNAQGGGTDLSDLPLGDVERIEVLRGGASALYGSDAVGGVINIVTRRGGNGKLRAKVQSGSWGTWGTSLSQGQGGRRGSYRWSVERLGQEGDFRYKDNAGKEQTRVNNSFQRNSGRLETRYSAGRWGEVEAGGELYWARRGVPGSLSWLSPSALQRDERYGAHLGHRATLVKGTTLNTRVAIQSGRRDYEDKPNFMDSRHLNHLQQAEMLAAIDTGRGRQLLFGADYRRDDVKSTDAGRRHRVTGGLFGQWDLGVGAFTLSPSVRVDAQTERKAVFTPRCGATLRVNRRLTLRAGANRSFRAPSFNDLYWPSDPWTGGNPALRPERAVELDGGLTMRLGRRGSLDVDYYNRDTVDLIAWQPDNTGKWTPQNFNRVRTQGVEVAAQAPVSLVRGLSARVSYAWLRARIKAGAPSEIGRQLYFRPEHQGTAGLRWSGRSWLVDLTATAVGDRWVNNANTNKLAGYGLLDATVRWNPSRRDELAIEVRNLLDHEHRTDPSYPVPGRELQFTAARTF
jgi:outer membrane cobalamin receptor